MLPNRKNQDEVLELANWRKSGLSSTEKKKKNPFIRDFVLQAPRRRKETIKKRNLIPLCIQVIHSKRLT